MPHREHVERIAKEHGLTPDDTIQRFVAADHLLKTNPAAAIQYLAQAHGVDLGTVPAPQQQQAPQVRAAARTDAQQIAQMQQEQAQQHQQQEQHLTAAITRFADGKPYWAQIEPQVVQQIHAMKMTDPGRVQADPLGALQEAEKQALKLSGIEPPERKAEARKKADEAKRLASLNVRSSITSPKPSFKTMEEEMAVTYERLNGRYSTRHLLPGDALPGRCARPRCPRPAPLRSGFHSRKCNDEICRRAAPRAISASSDASTDAQFRWRFNAASWVCQSDRRAAGYTRAYIVGDQTPARSDDPIGSPRGVSDDVRR